MSLWAIIPVKPLRRGKSRLATILSEDERAKLNYAMLENTLKVVSTFPDFDEILVISRDPAALTLARQYNARTVKEEGNPELNKAVMRAARVAMAFSAHGVMIIPADLPLICIEDLKTFIALSGQPPEIIIAPDRRLDGTNALLISPVGLIDYCYGPQSFEKHIQQAKNSGANIKICNLPSFALDVDWPEDFNLLKNNANFQLGF
jgi:2-phospho-L-lactate/phosphoenolpyruvate guanylyltransferase